MTDLTNYPGLQAAVADWLNREDLTSQVPAFISLAHSKLQMELRVRDMHKRTTLTATGEFLTLPTDFLEIHTLSNGAVGRPALAYIGPAKMAELPRTPSNGNTIYYTIIGNELQFYPAPTSALTLPIVYFSKVPVLSGTTATNWLLDKAPGAYLYGSLLEAMPFLKNDDRIPTWETARQQVIDLVTAESERALRPATKLVARTRGF